MNIKCYDNGGETADRYTVVYLDQSERQLDTFGARGMSADPFHPQGYGMYCSAMIGPHLGKEIDFTDLPPDCQRLVKQDLNLP